MIRGSEGWWLDTSATSIMNLVILKIITKDGKILMGDHHTKVARIDKVEMKFTSRKRKSF